MTVRAIMTPDPLTLGADDTIGHAADLILSNEFINLPIVDANRRYRAMFGVFELVELLLPPGATIMPDLDFIPENMADLIARLEARKGDAVGPHGRTDLPLLKPETPILEALLLFHRNRSSLPVVEPASGRLVGILSYWDAVRAAAGRRP